MAHIRIGCSGWHYKHWVGPFYPEKLPASKMLAHYLSHFDAVEINNSFYKLPNPETFTNWREATPKNFCFAVKASRFITHNKKLSAPENALEKFFPPVEELREKLGPILFQLPPKWRCNAERLEQFLSLLPKRHRYTFEFRETSWLCDNVYEILKRHNAAFCIYELGGFHSPFEVTADWAYIRLHGPGGKYQGSYSHPALDRWAHWIHDHRHLRQIHVYFDNDQAAYAPRNALELKQLVAEQITPQTHAA
jgi:uncharacterized protein YecE (DUF72 family)